MIMNCLFDASYFKIIELSSYLQRDILMHMHRELFNIGQGKAHGAVVTVVRHRVKL